MGKLSPRRELTRDQVTDDMPLRLDVAARLAFPDGTIGASALRSEAAKGRLEIWRIAGKDMTTLKAIAQMIERCMLPARNAAVAPRSGQDYQQGSVDSGASLAAARYRAEKLVETTRKGKMR